MGAEPAARFRGLGLCGLDAARPAGRDDETPPFGAAAGRRRHAVLRQTADAGRKRRLTSSLLVFLQRRGVRGPRRWRAGGVPPTVVARRARPEGWSPGGHSKYRGRQTAW